MWAGSSFSIAHVEGSTSPQEVRQSLKSAARVWAVANTRPSRSTGPLSVVGLDDPLKIGDASDDAPAVGESSDYMRVIVGGLARLSLAFTDRRCRWRGGSLRLDDGRGMLRKISLDA